MQEKIQIFSPIKQRILYFIDYLKDSKRNFYSKTGISRGTLESNSGITEETLAKFIATFPEIDIYWLITGKGEMLSETNTLNKDNDMNCSECPYKKIVERYEKDLDRYQNEIEYLNEQLQSLRSHDNASGKQKCA